MQSMPELPSWSGMLSCRASAALAPLGDATPAVSSSARSLAPCGGLSGSRERSRRLVITFCRSCAGGCVRAIRPSSSVLESIWCSTVREAGSSVGGWAGAHALDALACGRHELAPNCEAAPLSAARMSAEPSTPLLVCSARAAV